MQCSVVWAWSLTVKTNKKSYSPNETLKRLIKSKKPVNARFYELLALGGELGIRTLETLRSTAFRVLHHRPLGQLSVKFLVI